jgi:ATP citrate (pro-S)-lyase
VARVAGTSASAFATEVQFGHAWAKANSGRETAVYKNDYLRHAGAHVPMVFDELSTLIGDIYKMSTR